MNVRNLFIFKYKGWILATVILVVFGHLSLSHGAGHLLVWPRHDVTAHSAAGVSLHPYEIRKGPISLAPEILPQASSAARQARIAVSGGDTIEITFFADVTYQVTVDSVTYHQADTMTINARLNDHKIGTVILTIGAEGFLITLQDMNRALLYRVTGDSRTTAGTVTEIDVTKIPPMIR